MTDNSLKIIAAAGVIITVVSAVVCIFIQPWCALVCVLTGLCLTSVFLVYTKKRIDKLAELNNYLSLVCSGNFELDIADNAEGELSILKNNLYKVIILLRSQNEQLKKDKVYLADSLADISHQLKTPLTSMMVMTDLISKDSDPDKRAELIGIMETQLDKMKWLITNLLKLSKLDAGTAGFKHEIFSVKEVISQSVTPFLVAMDLKGINFIDMSSDFEIKGDDNWSTEAFANIIKNCLEHTERDGTITVSSEITTLYNSIIITDNGCGIAPQDLPHVFERFYHGKNSGGDSVGIGLALAKAVFENENAGISVESRENEGTKFEIKFYKSVI